MLHEVPDQAAFLAEVIACLKPSGRLLIVEPRLHVSGAAFERSVAIANVGLEPIARPTVALSRAVLFSRRSVFCQNIGRRSSTAITNNIIATVALMKIRLTSGLTGKTWVSPARSTYRCLRPSPLFLTAIFSISLRPGSRPQGHLHAMPFAQSQTGDAIPATRTACSSRVMSQSALSSKTRLYRISAVVEAARVVVDDFQVALGETRADGGVTLRIELRGD